MKGKTSVVNPKYRSRKAEYQQGKAVGLCVYIGCKSKRQSPYLRCPKHLERMAGIHFALVRKRKAEGLCVYCAMRPPFWSVRCVICRQLPVKNKNQLPAGLRRALRLYREAERQRQLEQRQIQARIAIRKLLGTGAVSSSHARALELYAGFDQGAWRTYAQVGELMHITKERVRQLLYPSKSLLAQMLNGNVPWPPLNQKPLTPQEKRWRARGLEEVNVVHSTLFDARRTVSEREIRQVTNRSNHPEAFMQ